MKTQGITKICSNQKGPTVGIMGVCHGNESVGMEALKFLKTFFSKTNIKKGTLYIMEGNPKAYKEDKICINNNLNRIFLEEHEMPDDIDKNGYEYSRQKELKPILQDLDYFLDLHAANKTSPEFSITATKSKEEKELAQIMPVKFFSNDWGKYIKGTSIQWVNKFNGHGVAIECGDTKSELGAQIAISAAKIFLKHLGLYDFKDATIKKQDNELILLRKEMVVDAKTFNYSKDYENFDVLKNNELVATDAKKDYVAKLKLKSNLKKSPVIVFPTEIDFIRKGQIKEAYWLGVL